MISHSAVNEDTLLARARPRNRAGQLLASNAIEADIELTALQTFGQLSSLKLDYDSSSNTLALLLPLCGGRTDDYKGMQ